MSERTTWGDVVAPLVARFDVAAAFNQHSYFNVEGSRALSALLREMARLLDDKVKARAPDFSGNAQASHDRTPEHVIKRLAEVANDIAFHAGVGGMETAGMFVSVLAEHPNLIDGFLRDGAAFLMDKDRFSAEHGCLNFHNQVGGISTPQEARQARTARKMLINAGAKPHRTGRGSE